MRLKTLFLALAIAASTHVFAEEVTIEVWHKLSDHESFEKRGEIRYDTDELVQIPEKPIGQTTRQQYQAKQQPKQQEPIITYTNAELSPKNVESLTKDFVLNVRAPIKGDGDSESEEESLRRAVDENGGFAETEEEYEQRLAEAQQDAALYPKTPGNYAFYQIKLVDERREWESLSSIKSCLLVASDFKETFTIHLDQDKNAYAFDYYTTSHACEEEHKKELTLSSLDQFKDAKVDVSFSNNGPKARYIKAQTIKLDETGKPAVEKTFLQKYWFYIVPAIIMLLFSGGEPEKTAS
ncbi:hypothetical protein BGW38_010032 [Lunasporangiospora selenospora]|uniref:Uncharacterized protein n=1 Tax=Lunasporangiospora selenospora TaxID=979761 RepID=A0A9P6FWM1_9FUNG|nr:hypothetical protein BGW38_010032 [Lunasporangiospora selenospora]